MWIAPTWRRYRVRIPKLLTALTAFSLCAGVVGCADFPGEIRQHTYPPDFQYTTDDQLHSAMWRLAEAIRQLNAILREADGVIAAGQLEASKRDKIMELLARMEHATDDLRTDGRQSNHPLLEDHLETFRVDVIQARRAVSSEPPSYVLAGVLTGGCLYCHSSGR